VQASRDCQQVADSQNMQRHSGYSTNIVSAITSRCTAGSIQEMHCAAAPYLPYEDCVSQRHEGVTKRDDDSRTPAA
jgi:hypothetical protein